MSNLQISQKITPFLWFDGRAAEAAKFYTSIFPNSEIVTLKYWGNAAPLPPDQVMMGTIIIDGLKVHLFDAGPQFKFNESFSLFVTCETQEEIDDYWSKLSDGGNESNCGWLKDKFGLSWQIVPEMLGKTIAGGEPEKVAKMFAALMTMKKLDIAGLENGYNS